MLIRSASPHVLTRIFISLQERPPGQTVVMHPENRPIHRRLLARSGRRHHASGLPARDAA